ncbi:MAG: hypothetical protein ABJL67_23810 [Sulfitobacter sp.]
MSNTDSFVEEVNEEVRRDQLYGMLRRYGWIAVLAIVLIVGGAAFSEYRKSQATAEAEALGDAMLAALTNNENAERAEALTQITPGSATSAAVLRLMTATAQLENGDTQAAVTTLNALAVDGDVPEIYRQLAQFKALTLQGSETPAAERRQALDVMAQPGNALRLLATEQLALIDIETGDAEAAIERYQSILSDAEVSADLQQRALQVIVALGGEPDLPQTLGAAGHDGSMQGN